MSILSFEHVSISQEGIPTLTDINLSVEAGDFYYLIGRTGSGKSTFFKSIFAELPIDEGQAKVVGYDLTKPRGIREAMADKFLHKNFLAEELYSFS
jgi:cell division transport system ATP-binding protein